MDNIEAIIILVVVIFLLVFLYANVANKDKITKAIDNSFLILFLILCWGLALVGACYGLFFGGLAIIQLTN